MKKTAGSEHALVQGGAGQGRAAVACDNLLADDLANLVVLADSLGEDAHVSWTVVTHALAEAAVM